jgi:hypothetical protein
MAATTETGTTRKVYRTIESIVEHQPLFYSGSELNSFFAYDMYETKTDSIVAFRGPADVSMHMVDREDTNNDDFIKSEDMLHFIVTMRGEDLEKMVVYQRLLMSQVRDFLNMDSEASPSDPFYVRLDGDDLMMGDSKMSVSIACKTTNGLTLIHAGVNVVPGPDCPVNATGLLNLGIDPAVLSYLVVDKFANEVDSIRAATYKVRSVD